MRVGNETATRFSDEIRIISRFAYFVALLAFLGAVIVFPTVTGRDPKAPALWVREILGLLGGLLLAAFVLLIGYIHGDAGRRGMSRLLWTMIAVFVPNALGIVLYFVLRKPRRAACPQCGTHVEAGFGFCPSCGCRLQPVCAHCQRGVDYEDRFCPYCGSALEIPKISEPQDKA